MGRNEAIEKAAREFCDACEACPETMAPVRVTTRMLAAHEQIIEALALPPDPAPDVRAVAERAAVIATNHARLAPAEWNSEQENAAIQDAVTNALSAHGDALTIDDLHREPYATFAHGDACICDDSLCGDPSHDDGGEARRKVIRVAEESVERMLATNIGRVEPLITAVLDLRDAEAEEGGA